MAEQKIRCTILGCGSSGGVPRIGGEEGQGDWGACDPNNPKNRRRRCSLLVERFEGTWHPDIPRTTILFDTSPDLREQLLDARVKSLDAVFISHDHADQLHGIDDLRALAIRNRRRIPVWYYPQTSPDLLQRFAYCFEQSPGSPYPAILEKRRIENMMTPTIIEGAGGDVPVTAFLQQHGKIESLGFMIGDRTLAYSSDVDDLSDECFSLLGDLDTWILDALRYTPHPTHAHVDKSVSWIQKVNARRGILTNLHVDLDYEELSGRLPELIKPAYDGLVVELPLH